MTIGGTRVRALDAFDVINPATGEAFAQAPACSADQLDDAFAAADGALAGWGADDEARREALRVAADALATAAEQIAPVLTAEQGRPLAQAAQEVVGSAIWLRWFADLEIMPRVVQDDDVAYVEVVRRPVGVVAAITPWNYPLLLAAWKLGAALRAGNTVVLKPSPYTPLSTLMMCAVLDGVLPSGVLNAVAGGDELGAWMSAHPMPRKVSFTGSVATGKRVFAAVASDLKRVTLELGGNDAAIILDDADPAAIADRIFEAAFANNGQTCSAIKRVYVAETLHDALAEELAERARTVVVGDGTKEGTELGPINNRAQLERVKELVAEALAAGGTALAGGHPLDRPGYFFAPTIVTGVGEGTRLVDEEQFGPALPIMPFRDLDEAVERANATSFGLCGSVWSADAEHADAVARRLECGSTFVNAHSALAPHQPFGGVKWSGIGVESGSWGLEAFTEIQTRYRAK